MIVVTAPTGRISSRLLRLLLDEDRHDLRVIARDPDRLPADVRKKVQVVVGSHSEPAVIDRAFRGADAVFWLLPPNGSATDRTAAKVAFAQAAVDAFARGDVGRVVGASNLGRGTLMAGRAGLATLSLAVDDSIAATGVPYRALALPGFMDNVGYQARGIVDGGVLAEAMDPDRRLPAVATRDIAAVAARLLVDESWTGFEEVPVLGPEDLSPAERAAILTDVLGRPVRYQQLSLDALRARLVGQGWSEVMAQAMVEMTIAKNEGLDNGVERTTENSTPTTFREWCGEFFSPAR
ncbi:NAD(P)H-binding protein [Cryptosporangium phraense]|uniref:NmrA family transcriptional regulator n=1 Tax=Cryptosporangium phraense TaxID=2593070 RepID=A0A545AFL0_9ACTN|nr:NAD(P)H-binding protein [Cryptosporangium phraense]TQS40109.1 NmrA family transcriptional regulator [Cryptosporangium phraense]